MAIALDHVVINVRFAMDEAVALFEALGFTVTPRGFHTLGSINHLIVFGEAYLELLGLPQDGERVRQELLDSPAGLDGLVFASADATATHAGLIQSGLSVQPVQQFSRPVDLEDGLRAVAHFEAVRLVTGQFAAGRVYFCHHLTPELVWRAPWQQHVNGTVGIAGLTVASADPERTRHDYARLGRIDARWGLDVTDEAGVARQVGALSGIGADRAERFAVLALQGVDLADITRRAAALDLPHHASAGRVCVGLPLFGVVLECRA
ncbi:VOC family protein [Corticimicrobacter populi]|nr:VOC family protein [Corticimicrobacter populi]